MAKPKRKGDSMPVPKLHEERRWRTISTIVSRAYELSAGRTGKFYSLPALEKAGVGKISRLPVSIRIVLESVLRNCDGKNMTEEHVRSSPTGAERAAHRGNSVRRRAHRAAGFHRRSPARSISPRCARRAPWARIRR